MQISKGTKKSVCGGCDGANVCLAVYHTISRRTIFCPFRDVAMESFDLPFFGLEVSCFVGVLIPDFDFQFPCFVCFAVSRLLHQKQERKEGAFEFHA